MSWLVSLCAITVCRGAEFGYIGMRLSAICLDLSRLIVPVLTSRRSCK